MRNGIARWGLLSVPVLACACAGSGVTAVGALGTTGQKIGGGASSLDIDPALCNDIDLIAKIAGSPAPNPPLACDKRPAEVQQWVRIATALSAYATALSSIAQSKDPTVDTQVNAALAAATQAKWASLSSSTDKSIATLADLISGFLLKGYRESELSDQIKRIDAPIQAVTAGLDGEIGLQLANISQVESAIDGVSTFLATAAAAAPSPPGASSAAAPSAPAGPAPSPAAGHGAAPLDPRVKQLQSDVQQLQSKVADLSQTVSTHSALTADQAILINKLAIAGATSLQQMRAGLEQARSALTAFKASVDAFAAAHKKIADASGNLDSADLLADVLAAIQAAAKAANP
jgi:hypothetical protein